MTLDQFALLEDLRRPGRRGRRLGHPPRDEQAFPYVFLDATYCKARVDGRVVSQAVVIATGVSAGGRREVLGCAVGDSETREFWAGFLRGLRERDLGGTQLVISDHHRGLVAALGEVLLGAAWQRCRCTSCAGVLAAARGAQAQVLKGQAEMVAAAVRTVNAGAHRTAGA